MAFSEDTKDKAFRRTGGRCECTAISHDHGSRKCSRFISRQGAAYRYLTAQSAGGSDGVENCQVVCAACHQMTGR